MKKNTNGTAYKFIIYFNKSSILKVHDQLNSDIRIFCF